MESDDKMFKRAFEFFDKDGNGNITLSEFKEVLTDLGDPLKDEECELFFKLRGQGRGRDAQLQRVPGVPQGGRGGPGEQREQPGAESGEVAEGRRGGAASERKPRRRRRRRRRSLTIVDYSLFLCSETTESGAGLSSSLARAQKRAASAKVMDTPRWSSASSSARVMMHRSSRVPSSGYPLARRRVAARSSTLAQRHLTGAVHPSRTQPFDEFSLTGSVASRVTQHPGTRAQSSTGGNGVDRESRPLRPRAPVLTRPPQDFQVASPGCDLARSLIPRAPVPTRPLQHLKVAFLRREIARVLVPRAPVLTSPLQHLQVASRSRERARSLIPRASVLTQPLKHLLLPSLRRA